MGTTSTNYCITHTWIYAPAYQISCSVYRARRTNVSVTSAAVVAGNTITAASWKLLVTDIEAERQARGLPNNTASQKAYFATGGHMDDADIERVRDRLEDIYGSVNSTRPGGISTTTRQYNRTKTDGGVLTAGTSVTGIWSTATGWTTASNPRAHGNINNTDYNGVIAYAGAIVDLRNKLIQKMKDCVCHADCGSHTACTCYSSHCNSYYY